MKLKVTTVLTFLFLLGCSNSNTAPAVFPSPTKPVATEQVDVNGGAARKLTLSNGMRVIVISVPELSRPAIALSVAVGFGGDIDGAPGTAHLIEHMLFNGNEDYPEPLRPGNHNGTSRNAGTGTDSTTYFLATNADNFAPELQKFSRMFYKPLFSAKYLDSERQVVDREYTERYLQSTLWRGSAALSASTSPTRSFAVGNRETLKDVTSYDLHKFFETYYSPRNMGLVIAAPLPIEQLHKVAVENFSGIPERGPVSSLKLPSNDAKINSIVRISSPAADDSLNVNIPFTSRPSKGVLNAIQVLTGFLGDEAQGSLLSVLQSKGYATYELGSIVTRYDEDENSFTLRIKLTEAGIKNSDEVIALVKAGVDFVKNQSEPTHIQDETRGRHEMFLRTQDFSKYTMANFSNFARKLATDKSKPWLEIIGQSHFTSYTASDYRYALDLLDLNRMQFIFLNSAPATNNAYSKIKNQISFSSKDKLDVVKINDTQYVVDGYYEFAVPIEKVMSRSIPSQDMALFRLPQRNPYIPTDFSLVSPESKAVLKTTSFKNAEIFMNSRGVAYAPKVEFTGLFTSTQMNIADKRDLARLILLRDYLVQSAGAELYQVYEAQVDFEMPIDSTTGALRFQLGMWSDSLKPVVHKVISALKFREDRQTFERLKQASIARISSSTKQSSELMYSKLQESYYQTYSAIDVQLKVIQEVTYEEVLDFYHRFFKNYSFKGVFSGNIKQNDADVLVQEIDRQWPMDDTIHRNVVETITQPQVTTRTQSTEYIANVNGSKVSEVLMFIQIGNTNARELAMTKILGQLMSQPFFIELREKQRIAYSPRLSAFRVGQYYGLLISVSSELVPTKGIIEASKATIENWLSEGLAQVTQEQIDSLLAIEQTGRARAKTLSSHNFVVEDLLSTGFKFPQEDESVQIGREEFVRFVQEKMGEPVMTLVTNKSEAEKAKEQPATIPEAQPADPQQTPDPESAFKPSAQKVTAP